MVSGPLAAFQERPGLAIGLGVGVLVLVTGLAFVLTQTRVYERPPTPAEQAAMVTLEDLLGSVPEGSGQAESLVRAFPSMPMLWLNYRRGGPVQLRSHLLRYDDVELAKQGVERFSDGDRQWVQRLDLAPLPLPSCVDAGTLHATAATEGSEAGFVLTARASGSYVHVSGTGWAPVDTASLSAGLCPSLQQLHDLPFPPIE